MVEFESCVVKVWVWPFQWKFLFAWFKETGSWSKSFMTYEPVVLFAQLVILTPFDTPKTFLTLKANSDVGRGSTWKQASFFMFFSRFGIASIRQLPTMKVMKPS